MYYVYAPYNNEHKKLYIGQTRSLEQRLFDHNQHTYGGYTSKFEGEWKLIYQELVSTRTQSMKREKQLKSGSGREFLRNYY